MNCSVGVVKDDQTNNLISAVQVLSLRKYLFKTYKELSVHMDETSVKTLDEYFCNLISVSDQGIRKENKFNSLQVVKFFVAERKKFDYFDEFIIDREANN